MGGERDEDGNEDGVTMNSHILIHCFECIVFEIKVDKAMMMMVTEQ